MTVATDLPRRPVGARLDDREHTSQISGRWAPHSLFLWITLLLLPAVLRRGFLASARTASLRRGRRSLCGAGQSTSTQSRVRSTAFFQVVYAVSRWSLVHWGVQRVDSFQ